MACVEAESDHDVLPIFMGRILGAEGYLVPRTPSILRPLFIA